MNIPRFVRTLVVACAGLVLIAATVLWFVRRSSDPPTWQQRLTKVPFLRPVDPNLRSSVWLQEQRVHLRNDLLRRDIWMEPEVDAVLEAINQSSPDYVVTDESEWDTLYERHKLAGDAQLTIRTRIGSGAPIEPAQRERLVEALLRRSNAADPLVRRSVAEALCWSGLIFEDPRVDARVQEMMEDPDPAVASNARRQYRWHSSNRELHEQIRGD